MRNEERKKCLEIGYAILLWLTGLENLTEDSIEDLRSDWVALLLPPQDNEREKHTFETLEELRDKILDL